MLLKRLCRALPDANIFYVAICNNTCGIDAASEYGTPEMLGWTAGVYLYLINESKYNAELK